MTKIVNPEEDENLLKKKTNGDEDDIENEDEDIDNDDDKDIEGDEDDIDTDAEKVRGKLNAQNRFLKKQGYVFEKGKGWVKPTETKVETKVVKKESSKSKDLSTSEVLTIVKAGVHEEDIPDLQEYAQMKGISIKEALETSFIKTLISNKEEERKTAEATHTGSSKRNSGKVTDEELLEKAKSGNLPEDPTKLAEARFNLRKNKGAKK